MRETLRKIKAAILIVAAFVLLTAAGANAVPPKKANRTMKGKTEKTAKANTFETPDFAYPETVIANAERVLRSDASDIDVVKAVVQLAVANNERSSASFNETVALVDSVAKARSGATSAILYSLEAQIVSQLGASIYSDRQLPLDEPFPADMAKWSEDMFRLKVLDLCRKSLADPQLLKNSPIEQWKPLLYTLSDEQAKLCPDLYTLLAARAQSYTESEGSDSDSPIPFFGSTSKYLSPGAKCKVYSQELLSQIIAHGRELKSPLLLGWFIPKKNLTKPELYKTLSEAYSEFETSSDSYSLLDDMVSVLKSIGTSGREIPADSVCSMRAETKKALENYITLFPKSESINQIRNDLSWIESYKVRLQGRNVYRSDADVQLKVIGVPGGKTMYVKIFRFGNDVGNLSDMQRILSSSHSTFVDVREVPGRSEDCRAAEDSVTFGKLPYGEYGAVLATDGGRNRSGIVGEYEVYTFDVSDLGYIVRGFSDKQSSDNDGVYIVDNSNGAPLSGVTVKFTSTYNGKKSSATVVTDASGFVGTPASMKENYNLRFLASKGADRIGSHIYGSYIYNNKDSKHASVYTDLALYHPGDTVKFVVVAFQTGPSGSKALADRRLRARVFDPSGVVCDTIAVATDRYGKATGEFALPTNGMNGTFIIRIEDDVKEQTEDGVEGFGFIEMADYVVPKFYVEVSTSAKNYKPGDIVKVEGRAMTFSGMPVADGEVKLKVDYRSYYPWRFYGYDSNSFAADLKTDSEGRFSLDLSTASLDDYYRYGTFTVNAAVTSTAGETQRSENAYFSLGAKNNLTLRSSGMTEITAETVKLQADVLGVDGTPQNVKLEYTLTDTSNGEVVASGYFTSPTLELDASNVKSGTYKWKVSDPESADSSEDSELILYRLSDRKPAYKTSLWVPVTEYVAGENGASVEIAVGSSCKDQYILYQLVGKDGIVVSRWLKADDEVLRVKTPAIPSGETMFANFMVVSDGNFRQSTVNVISRAAAEKLKSEVVTFRDKITAGGKETWRFRYTLGDRNVSVIPVSATMTDKALNSIRSFSWTGPWLYYWTNHAKYNGVSRNRRDVVWNISGKMHKVVEPLNFPNLNTYYALTFFGPVQLYDMVTVGYGLATPESVGANSGQLRIRGTKKMAVNAAVAPKMEAVEEKESELYDSVSSTGAASEESADSGESGEVEIYRPSECPVAFFMPSLLTDSDGVLDLSFTAPDYNTTWQLQLLAYDPENMKSDLRTMQAVASKKVMVQSQLPRFLRTGDKSVFAFTTFNNSGEEAEISVKAEIYDPLTGKTLAEKSYTPRKVADSASFVETIDFTAPSDITAVGVRVYATLGESSDGEQSLVGILPSSTPVTESTPFYMAPDETSFSLSYPAGDAGSQTMFSYCDNPVWYCVTALPDMTFPKDASILSTLRHLYGNSIAFGLTSRYPKLREAISLWSEKGDSTLVSPLQRDEAMKVIALGDTPWTLNAESETLRMGQLTRLLDTEACSAAISDAVTELLKRQRSDGSWSWCEGMRPSTYVTSRVLLYLSMLRRMDFLPKDKRLDEAIRKAVKYTDKELYSDYIKSQKRFSTTTMLNYMYVRSGLGDIAMDKNYASLQKLALQAVQKEWKEFSIYNTAVAAIVLSRNGYPMEARSILESLRQKALTSKERGMWFDNLNSSWNGRNKLITTMQVLEAYHEITPGAPQIDGLRQWLLIQRQTEDWGNADEIAEVVYAILSSGSDWTADFAPATFRINGKDVEVGRRDALTGSFTMPLDAKGGYIEITKSAGHQAWGGVLSRRILPITEVKPYSASDITVSKRVLKVIENADGVHTETLAEGEKLRKGDKVRIEIMLTSQRDMDYVCVIDGRSAALSPIQQLSGYVWQDGSGYYRDVQNDCTNLFFDFLPKGVTYTGYDCFVSQDGVYSQGIAQTQCLYAPLQTAHSGGSVIEVEN